MLVELGEHRATHHHWPMMHQCYLRSNGSVKGLSIACQVLQVCSQEGEFNILGTNHGTLDQPICAFMIFSWGSNWNRVYSHKPYTLNELKEVIRDKKWWDGVQWDGHFFFAFFINSTVVIVSTYTTEVENYILLQSTRDYISWDFIVMMRGHILRDILDETAMFSVEVSLRTRVMSFVNVNDWKY